jgi:hypothetical protein
MYLSDGGPIGLKHVRQILANFSQFPAAAYLMVFIISL